ncbi:GGDEF domain-containing protein [Lacicoccus alkaliphilus]|uniref:Diguanylate cyclase n=1 Tax=Lacicoccus alkaliphilus DSM 16010 TaxID=1123231 RepID=A0A1M7CSS8_9BACL|nr:GGDEF domain-containing protein [Salinicoccus alkaliphilus]SHL69909.1 diguanylate cyclase [Salinicoccus alkaliphilus DSM 16010]
MFLQMFTLVCILIALQFIYYQIKWRLGFALMSTTREKVLSGIVGGFMSIILSFYAVETQSGITFGLGITALLICLVYSGRFSFLIGAAMFAVWIYALPYHTLIFPIETYIWVSALFIIIETMYKDSKVELKGLSSLVVLSFFFFLHLYQISSEIPYALGITALYLTLTTVSLLTGIGIIRYQQEFVRLHRRLAAEATHDGLTGLLNRRSFEEAIKQLDSKNEAVLLMIDIDHFKKINDTYGHPAGDAVLEATADALREACKVKETIARVGGEEFAVLLRHHDMESAKKAAEDIRAAIEALSIELDEETLKITISIGLASYPEQVRSPEQLYKLADEHLYIAKKLGRNQVCCERKKSVIVE